MKKGGKIMRKIFLLSFLALVTLSFLVGCSGMVFAPRDGSIIMFYPRELPEAAQAVEDAQKAGKDKACSEEFQAAKKHMEDAYQTYWACRTEEAIKMAKDATQMAKALCPPPRGTQKTSATVPVTSPPPSPAPTPPPAPAPPPAQKVLDKMTLHVNFDFDKYKIRKADEAELKKVIDFVKKYPNSSVKIEGHTDSIGTEKYNQKLSERRARAVADYLISKGAVKKVDISTVGYGESKPIADNKTTKGRAENRRAEILILEK
jgi:outer membrane protein OmpA-like peptidoglycan-associated protein